MKIKITDADYAQACLMEFPFRDAWKRISKRAREIVLDRMIDANQKAQRVEIDRGTALHGKPLEYLAHMDVVDKLFAEHDALMTERFGCEPLHPRNEARR